MPQIAPKQTPEERRRGEMVYFNLPILCGSILIHNHILIRYPGTQRIYRIRRKGTNPSITYWGRRTERRWALYGFFYCGGRRAC